MGQTNESQTTGITQVLPQTCLNTAICDSKVYCKSRKVIYLELLVFREASLSLFDEHESNSLRATHSVPPRSFSPAPYWGGAFILAPL